MARVDYVKLIRLRHGSYPSSADTLGEPAMSEEMMSDDDHSAVLLHLPLVTSVAVVHGTDADVYELTFWDAAGSGDLAAAIDAATTTKLFCVNRSQRFLQ